MATAKIGEVKRDIEELELLQKQATRRHVIDVISLEIRKLGTELIKLQDEKLNEPTQSVSDDNTTNDAKSMKDTKHYQVKINGYGWDQSDKYVKVFVTLKNVHTIPKKDVFCTLTERSMELHVKNLENRDYNLVINNFVEPINVEDCHWKQKTDMVVVFLSKGRPFSTWTHMTEIEKRFEETKSNKFKTEGMEKKDPQDSLMGLMRNMYESGDDDMKRMIAKAWTEGQEKRTSNMDTDPAIN